MKALKKAIRDRMATDSGFAGTTASIRDLCGLSSHSIVDNLLSGKTDPWLIRVQTMERLIRVFPSLTAEDFYERPGSQHRRAP